MTKFNCRGTKPPRGMYPGRLDDKGRMKMPAAFQQYFAALPEKKLFVTSLDRRIAQIYPMEVWRQNEKFFETYRDNPELAKKVAFNAADLGVEAEMDAQGRITFPPELRRELGMEDQTVRLYRVQGPDRSFEREDLRRAEARGDRHAGRRMWRTWRRRG